MPRITRFLAWPIGVLTLGLGLVAAHAEQMTNIRFVLDWNYEGEESEFTVPHEDGTFQHYNLNVQIDRGAGSGDTVVKVGGGAYDMGYADFYTMVRFNHEHPDHRLIAVAMNQDASAMGISTLAGSGIVKPQDLNGKKIGAPPDAAKQIFPFFAAVNKIDMNSIQWNSISSDMRDTMLVRGSVDAVTGNVTTTMMNARAMGVPEGGIRPFIFASYGVPLYGSAIITTPAFAEAHPEAVRNFIRAVAHGLNVMITKPEAALATVKKYDPLLDDKIELARIKISLQYMLITDHVRQHGFSQVDMVRLQKTLDDVAPTFGINPPPKAADVYIDKYLPPPADLKVAAWQPG